ncbi:MAG TPA: hypothetical protein DEH78_23425, partial [Solibacterales bacterium]|nr:hypothetical protein [Bryobacterales bacterium]
ILERAEHACERCGKPNLARVLAAVNDPAGRWTPGPNAEWRDREGRPCPRPYRTKTLKWVRVVLTCAHLNHNPTDNRAENLQALCQRCHLEHDQEFHQANARRTRARKRGQLWLSQEIENISPPW